MVRCTELAARSRAFSARTTTKRSVSKDMAASVLTGRPTVGAPPGGRAAEAGGRGDSRVSSHGRERPGAHKRDEQSKPTKNSWRDSTILSNKGRGPRGRRLSRLGQSRHLPPNKCSGWGDAVGLPRRRGPRRKGLESGSGLARFWRCGLPPPARGPEIPRFRSENLIGGQAGDSRSVAP